MKGTSVERSRYSSEFTLGSLTTITICADYVCPWCYPAVFQAKKLTEQFGVSFDWRGFELYPPGMVVAPRAAVDPNAPPSRFDRFMEVEGISNPTPRPPFKRSHLALLGAEWALMDVGPEAFTAYNEAVYRAYWDEHRDISKLNILAGIAESVGLDGAALWASVIAKRYESHIVPYDEESYSLEIRNVPTFIFGTTERLSEANYTDLARATERFLLRSAKYAGK
jgi:predicted DsbA family dithiol-disulfide isomerase